MDIAQAQRNHAALSALRRFIKRTALLLQWSILTFAKNDLQRTIIAQRIRGFDNRVRQLDRQIEEIEAAYPSLRLPDDNDE